MKYKIIFDNQSMSPMTENDIFDLLHIESDHFRREFIKGDARYYEILEGNVEIHQEIHPEIAQNDSSKAEHILTFIQNYLCSCL
jgi:hypothetical protein